jgi:hypothetical protein
MVLSRVFVAKRTGRRLPDDLEKEESPDAAWTLSPHRVDLVGRHHATDHQVDQDSDRHRDRLAAGITIHRPQAHTEEPRRGRLREAKVREREPKLLRCHGASIPCPGSIRPRYAATGARRACPALSEAQP